MCCSIAIAGALAGWHVVLNIYLPAGGYDDFVYHLPVVGFVIQSGSLGIVPVPFHFGNVNYFSQLGELFSLWDYSILGSDTLINIWQDGALLQLLLATYVLCRALGCRRLVSVFAASLICFTPTLLMQTRTAYNDILLATFFATGLALAMRPFRVLGAMRSLAIGLSCGLMLAAKMSAPLLIAAVAASLIFNSLDGENRRRALGRMRLDLAVIALATACLGGYWYIRNTFVFHNPMYPFQVRMLGRTFKGVLTVEQMTMDFQNPELARKPAIERVVTPWLETRRYGGDYFYNYDSTWAGFGPIWFVVGVPSIAAALIAGLAGRRGSIAALLLIVASAFALFAGDFVVRFSLFVLPAMSAAVAWTLHELAANRPLAPAGAKGLIYRLPSPAIQAACLLLGTLTAAIMLPTTLSPMPAVRQIVSPVDKADVPNTFIYNFHAVHHAIPPAAVVLYDETCEYLSPLWRDDFSNQVRYVPTDRTWREWLSRAQALHATHVFVKSESAMDVSKLPSWIRAHPDCFQLLAHTLQGDLYKLKSAGGHAT